MIQTLTEKIEAERRRRASQDRILESSSDKGRGLHPATKGYQARVHVNQEKIEQKKNAAQKFDPEAYDTLTPKERRNILLDRALIMIEPITHSVLQKRRRSFNSTKKIKFPLPAPCWVCRTREAIHRHHVILLKNGGPVSSRKNVVLLCERCHVDIHPWMEINESKQVTSEIYELTRVKREAVEMLERAAKGRFDNPEQVDVLFCSLIRRVFNKLAIQ